MVQTKKTDEVNIYEVNVSESGASMKKHTSTKQNRTGCIVIERNKPNLLNMAKASIELYKHVKINQPELLN